MIQFSLIYIKPILVQYARVLVSVTQEHFLISSLCNTVDNLWKQRENTMNRIAQVWHCGMILKERIGEK